MQSFWLKTSWIQYVLSVVPPGIIRFKLCVVACETSKGCAKKAKKGFLAHHGFGCNLINPLKYGLRGM